MRRLLVFLPVLLLSTACTSYEGESFPRVAQGRETRTEASVPPGYRVIGVAVGEASCCSSSSFSEPDCSATDRAMRRLRRAAAREGGEVLVDVWCHDDVHYDEYYDPEEGWTYEVSVYTDCEAEVARAWSHDRD